jgi:hypothetical protein
LSDAAVPQPRRIIPNIPEEEVVWKVEQRTIKASGFESTFEGMRVTSLKEKVWGDMGCENRMRVVRLSLNGDPAFFSS